MTSTPGLTLESIRKSLGGQEVIKGLDLSAQPGELVSLLGPSGCGKSTTLRVIGGFLFPDAGRVLIEGQDVTSVPPERRPTAMVFQNYALWPHMSVFDNVAFGLRVRRTPKPVLRRRVGEVLRLVGMLEMGGRRPARISGGQQQRVALARALVLEPKVLLLDEPLSNLDAKLRVQVREEIRDLQQRLSITTVFVTHDQDEALSISDRVAVMSNGLIEQFSPPDLLYRCPETRFVAEFVGAMNFYRGRYVEEGVWLEPEGTVVPCVDAHSADGETYDLGVRPEEVRLAREGEPGAPARREKVIPRGPFSEVVFRTGRVTVRAYLADGRAAPEEARLRFGRVLRYRDGTLVR